LYRTYRTWSLRIQGATDVAQHPAAGAALHSAQSHALLPHHPGHRDRRERGDHHGHAGQRRHAGYPEPDLGPGHQSAASAPRPAHGARRRHGRPAATAVVCGRNWTTSVIGSTNAWLETGNWTVRTGRVFTDAELRAGAAVCLIGETVRRELFGTADAVGGQLRVKAFSCEVVGVLASKGQGAFGNDQDDTVLVPLRTLQRRVTGNTRVNTLLVSMKDGSDPERVKATLTQLLRELRKLSDSDEDNFNVLDTKQLADTLSGTTKVLTTLLGAVAAVSLLVGGIGIMNIMLVSVTERTREIGLRLAIGALEREVLLQFLIEAVVLAALGGLIGIVLATGASLALSGLMGVPYLFNPGVNLLSFLFSAGIGVVFGYFTARRAARMDPIDALRHE